MKKLYFIIAILIFSCNSFAHKEWVHQYLVWEAYKFLEYELGYEITDFKNHVGLNYYGRGDDNYPWSTGYIGVAAWREDLEDVIWLYGSFANGWDPSSTHFWKADEGDDVLTPIPLSGDAENAYYKARIFLFGGHPIFISGVTFDPQYGTILGRFYSYDSLVDFFKTGHCYFEGYIDLGGGIHYVTPVEINMYLPDAQKIAYQILGRVSHLLADMSVPAHSHNDFHVCTFPASDGDYYELTMGGNLAECNEEQTVFYAQNWDMFDAHGQGDLLPLQSDDLATIRYLFYTLNQLSDHFPSGTGQMPSFFDDPGNNYLPNGTYPIIDERYQILGNPPTYLLASDVASETFNYAIRATATLYYWFALETGMLPKITAKNNFEHGTIKVGVNTTPTQKNSPYIFGAITGQTVNLEAQNQSYGGYERIWNTSGVSNSISKWTKQVGSTITDLTNGGNITYSFTVTTSDDNASYIANLKNNYRIDQSHTFEFDATQNQQNTSYIVEQNSGEILAPSNKTVSGKNYKFIRWEDVASNPRIISPGDNENYTAYYKFPNHSNYLSAYSNNGSKQFLRTPDGRLHKAYESINGVWYEMSEDNGQTWQIIGSNFNTNGWSSHQPSLSYYQDGADKIHVFMYYRLLRGEPNDWLQFQEYIYDSSPNPEIYESENLSPSNPIGGFTYTNPIIACAENGKILFVWESSLNGVGQKLIYSYGKKLSNGYWEWYDTGTLEFTNNGAKNPTVVASQNLNDLKFHLAWNEGYEVYYTALYPDASNHMLNTGKQWVSNGSGYPYNNKPSIIEMSNLARISWIGSRFIDESPTGQVEYKTILKNLGNNTYKRFGSNTTSVSLTRDEDNSEYFLAWSE